MAENWQLYSVDLDGQPGACMVDVGLADSIPDPKRTVCIMVRVPFKDTGEYGRGDQAERDALAAVEDRLFPDLRRQFNALHVATIRGGGQLDYWFYIPAGRDEEFLEAIGDAFDDYEVEGGGEPDPEWNHYREALFPDEGACREIADLSVINALLEAGDPLTHPRPIEHLALFPSESAARKFATIVKAEGFEIASVENVPDFDHPWAVEAIRPSPATPEEIIPVTTWLAQAAAEHGGEYDGWQCLVLDEHGRSRSDDADS